MRQDICGKKLQSGYQTSYLSEQVFTPV